MPAEITFWHSHNVFELVSGSGIGFYGGAGFGAPVLVDAWQDRSFATNSDGTQQGGEMNNVKWVHDESGIIGPGATGDPLNIRNIPNYQNTLNIRFTNDDPVATQNAELRIFDRVNIDNPASGVRTRVFEGIHPEVSQAVEGSGDTTWTEVSGSSVTLSLITSPGESGERPDGVNTQDDQHDWYVGISASPLSIGSKDKFGLWFSVEFL